MFLPFYGSGIVLLNSDKSKQINDTEKKKDEPNVLLDESYANEAKNSKLLAFIQNYFIKSNHTAGKPVQVLLCL